MRAVFVLLLMLIATPVKAQPLPTLQGDEKAIVRIERMFARIGGREQWAQAQSMYIRYRQLSSGRRAGEGEERAWRHIARPGERLEFVRTDHQGRTSVWGRSYDERGGWRRDSDGMRPFLQQEHREALNLWPRDFYTAFRRMAAADPAWRYRFTEPNRIEVTEASDAKVGWWDIDEAGTLLRWGTTDAQGEFSYIYGPYRAFGSIAFPAWGVQSDGIYRFEYLEFAISPKPLPDEVFRDPATPPRRSLRLR